MRIVVVMGTYRKHGAGAGYVARMADAAAGMPGVEFDYVWLGDYDLKLCRGCMACYEKGEGACPLKDGYLDAMRRLNSADAAIFYTPTYALSISGMMKTFFDRSSWVLHRPFFKGRHALVLASVAAYGERTALATLKMIVSMMGFAIAGSFGVVNARFEAQPKYRARVDRMLANGVRRLVERAGSRKPVRPSLFELVAFNFQKSVFGEDTPGCANDKRFWKQAGWAGPDSEYYCEASIPGWKKLLVKAMSAAVRRFGLLPG